MFLKIFKNFNHFLYFPVWLCSCTGYIYVSLSLKELNFYVRIVKNDNYYH